MDELENEIKLSPPTQQFDDEISNSNDADSNKIKSSDGKLAVKPVSTSSAVKAKPAKVAV